MKELLSNIFGPEAGKEIPVWKTGAFLDWYDEQSARSEDEQSAGYREYLKEVQAGRESLPTDEERARQKTEELRNKM